MTLDDTEGSEKIIVSDKSGKSTLVFDSAKGRSPFQRPGSILSAKGDLTIDCTASPSTAALVVRSKGG